MSEFNELIVLSEKKKKGQGLGAILKLIEALVAFSDGIQDCIDAQDIMPNKQKLEPFLQDVKKMSDTLLEMAKEGIQSRPEAQVEGNGMEEEPEPIAQDEQPMPSKTFSLEDLKGKLSDVGQYPLNAPSKPMAPKA